MCENDRISNSFSQLNSSYFDITNKSKWTEVSAGGWGCCPFTIHAFEPMRKTTPTTILSQASNKFLPVPSQLSLIFKKLS